MSRAPVLMLLSCLPLLASGCGRDSESADRTASDPAPAPERIRSVGELVARVEAKRPVIVVGLDGADWQFLDPLLADEVMPNLARLREESAWGVLTTETPSLSPLLWTSMMTGVSPIDHGVLDFSRFHPLTGTREPITSDERRAPAIWNDLTWSDKSVAVLGLWATYPAEAVRGTIVSDRLFGFLNLEAEPPAGAIYPPGRERWAEGELARARQATGYGAVREYLPWLTADEYAAHATASRPYDHPISALRRILIETRLYAGLAESLLAGEEAPDVLVAYLQGTDSIGHVFAPFAAPRQASVPPADFERYREVPERYFREVDRFLGRLVAAAERTGAAIVLVSDHGFRWGEGRPERLSSNDNTTAARWHRREGIWLVRADGVRAGSGVEGRIRQVYPTLLALAGLPAAANAEGQPLAGMAPPAGPPYDYAKIYRELATRRRAAPPEAGTSRAAADERLAELRALGYLGGGEAPSAPEAARSAGSTRTAGSFNNEGVIRRGEGRDAEAAAAFEQALVLQPDLASALWNLSDLLYARGEQERSDELLVRAVANDLPEGVQLLVGRAIAYQRAGELSRSLSLVDRAVTERPLESELWMFRGRYRVEAGECVAALADFEQAANLNPDLPAALNSAALAHLCLNDPASASDAFRRSLALDADQPRVRAMLAGLSRGR